MFTVACTRVAFFTRVGMACGSQEALEAKEALAKNLETKGRKQYQQLISTKSQLTELEGQHAALKAQHDQLQVSTCAQAHTTGHRLAIRAAHGCQSPIERVMAYCHCRPL
jgi:hypothetical protein